MRRTIGVGEQAERRAVVAARLRGDVPKVAAPAPAVGTSTTAARGSGAGEMQQYAAHQLKSHEWAVDGGDAPARSRSSGLLLRALVLC